MTARAQLAYAARLLGQRLREVSLAKGEKSPQTRLRKKLEAEARRVARELAESKTSDSAPLFSLRMIRELIEQLRQVTHLCIQGSEEESK